MAMLPPGLGKTDSRANRRQIMAYLDPHLVSAAHALANRQDKTIQEVVGDAINAALEAHGRAPVISTGHQRVIRRKKGVSTVRSDEYAIACRSGKRPLGGYFPREEADSVKGFLKEVELSVDKLVEFGIRRLTGAA